MDKDLKDSLYLINNGFAFFVTTLLFAFAGQKLDELWGTKYFFLILGFLGLGLSLYLFFVLIPKRKDDKNKEERKKEEEKIESEKKTEIN